MRYFGRLKKTYEQWQADDGSLMAAAVAYYAALSFFPVLLVLISGIGFVLQWTQWGQDSEAQVLAAIGDYATPAVQRNVRRILEGVQQQAVVGGPVGLVALLFAAAALFAHFERAFDRIWSVDSPASQGIWRTIKNILFHRLRAFLLLLGLGVLILVIIAAGVALASVRQYAKGLLPQQETIWQLLETAMSVVLNTGVFCLIYKWLPKTHVRWTDALQGAVLVAAVWELGRMALTLFVVGDKYSAYGVVGSFIAVMLWMYYAAMVQFLGAEYVQVISREYQHRQAIRTSDPG
jgi:membrane protein